MWCRSWVQFWLVEVRTTGADSRLVLCHSGPVLRLRQVVWVAADLEAAEGTISGLLGLRVGYRDPGVAHFGLANVVMPCGDQFVEVVSPIEDDTTAGRLLTKRFGDGGYMVIVQTDSLDWVRTKAEELDMRIVFEAEEKGVVGLHFHPADVGSAILSVDACDEPAEWPWAGPEWRDHVDSSVVDAVVAVELQAADPDAVAQRWSALLDRPVEDDLLKLDDADIRFVRSADGRGDGLRAVDFRAVDRERVGEQLVIHGVVVNFR